MNALGSGPRDGVPQGPPRGGGRLRRAGRGVRARPALLQVLNAPHRVALDLDAIPIVDNHCHSLLRQQPPDDDAFRIHLTESYFPEIARDHVPTIDLLPPGAGRARRPARLRADPGRRPRGPARPRRRVADARDRRARELQDLADRHRLRRGHDVLARRAPEARPGPDRGGHPPRAADRAADPRVVGRFDAFIDAYRAAISDLRSRGIVGMKSVIAYRTGLHVEDVRATTPRGRSPGRARPACAPARCGSSRSRCSTTSS